MRVLGWSRWCLYLVVGAELFIVLSFSSTPPGGHKIDNWIIHYLPNDSIITLVIGCWYHELH